MTTKPEGFWWFRSGTFDSERFQADLAESIPSLYRSKGYLDFRILSDSLVVDPETGKTRVELQVEEGQRYRLGEFSVDGNRHFSSEELEAYFETSGGGGGGGEMTRSTSMPGPSRKPSFRCSKPTRTKGTCTPGWTPGWSS